MPTQLREAHRTARKEYRCGGCNGVIKIGERHHVSTNLWDGRVYDWRTCAACAEDHIIGEVYYWAGYPDEGVDYESAWEWAHECRTDLKYGEIARRWLARSGCKCERCEAATHPLTPADPHAHAWADLGTPGLHGSVCRLCGETQID